MAIVAAVVASTGRRHDLRRAVVAASLFGIAGAAVGRSMGLAEPLPLHLGVATVALGAAAFPLAVPGALLEGRSMWWPAPRRRSVPWAAACAGVLAVVVATAPLLAVDWIGGGVTGIGGAIVVVLLAATTAVTAGAAVPLRRDRAGDQVVSFSAFLVGCAAAGLGIGQAGSRLVGAGVPDPVVASAAVALSFGVASAAIAARMARG